MKVGPSRFKKISLAAVGLSMLAIAAGVYFILNPRKQASDPGVARTNWLSAYQRAVGPSDKAPAVPADPFGPITMETNEAEVTFAYVEGHSPSDTFDAGFKVADPSQRVELDGGAVYLKYLAVAWDVVKTNFDYAVRMEGAFYNNELQSVPASELHPKLQPWDRELDFRGSFPEVRFYFGTTNLANFQVLGMEAYDGRTRGSLTTGYSTSRSGDGFYFEHAIRRWHGGPLDLILYIAHGDPQVFTMRLEPGAEQKVPGRVIKYAGYVKDGASWSGHNNGKTNLVTFRGGRSSQRQSSVMLLEWPSTHRSPLKFELLDANGKIISTGGGNSGTMRSMRIHEEGNPASLRVTYFPKRTRCLFKLRTVPGIPAENENLSNLLLTKVPFMRVEAEWDFESDLESLLQLDIPMASSGKFPPGYFPRVFTNITAEALLIEYYKYSGVRPQFKIMNEAGKAEFIQPPWQQVLNKFIAWFEK